MDVISLENRVVKNSNVALIFSIGAEHFGGQGSKNSFNWVQQYIATLRAAATKVASMRPVIASS